MPEGNDVTIACFDVIFDNVALGRILYLLLLFLLAAHLVSLAVYFKIADTRTDDISLDTYLVLEKCLADVANVGTLMPKKIGQVRVVKIYFLDLS